MKKRSNILNIFVIIFFVVCIAAVYSPFHFHYSGTDASNYVGNSVVWSKPTPASTSFYPKEISKDKHSQLSKNFIRNGSNSDIFTPYVYASNNNIIIPHKNSTGRIMALIRKSGSIYLSDYLNYFLLGLSGIFLYFLSFQYLKDKYLSLLTSLVFIGTPGVLTSARYPMSEILCGFLLLATFLFSVKMTKNKKPWAILFLLPLMATRPEFSIIFCFCLFIFGYFRYGFISALSAITFTFIIGVFKADDGLAYLHLRSFISKEVYGVIPLASFVFGYALSYPFRYLIKKSSRIKSLLNIFDLNRNYRPLTLIITSLSLFVIFDALRQQLPVGESYFFLRGQRYSTIEMLFFGSSMLFVLIGCFGWILNSKYIKYFDLFLIAFFAPQFMVFLNMASTPSNKWYWARRFVVLIYPLIALGIGFFLLNLKNLLKEKYLRKFHLHINALPTILIAFLFLSFYLGRYKIIPTDYLRQSELELFHSSAKVFPDESIIILNGNSFSKAASFPLRTFHNLYAFVTWNPKEIDKSLEILSKSNKPIYIDDTIQISDDKFFKSKGLPINVVFSPSEKKILVTKRVHSKVN